LAFLRRRKVFSSVVSHDPSLSRTRVGGWAGWAARARRRRRRPPLSPRDWRPARRGV